MQTPLLKDNAVETEILRQVAACEPGQFIAPGDIARALNADWRPLLSAVRRAALRLQAAGQIDILRKGRPVPAEEVRGIIRLRLRT